VALPIGLVDCGLIRRRVKAPSNKAVGWRAAEGIQIMALAKIEREMTAAGKGTLGKAADDEPVFILRAKDRYAPQIVEAWARAVDCDTFNVVSGTENIDATRAKIKEARALAHSMRAWQELNSCKRPD
jgi:hypothetical protein